MAAGHCQGIVDVGCAKERSHRLLLVVLVAIAFAALPAAPAFADVVRAEISWSGANDQIDLHVTDFEGNGAQGGGSSIPNTTYVGDNSGERVQQFIDHDDPSTRTFCYVLDNFGSESTVVNVTFRDPDGSVRQGSITMEPGTMVDLGSSPAGTPLVDGRCAGDDDPVLGSQVRAAPVSGTVLVKPRGACCFEVLDEITGVPVGSQFDTTNGVVGITTQTRTGGTQSIEYYDGVFMLDQAQSDLVTAKVLGSKKACKSDRSARRGGGDKIQLWGRGSGNHRSRGRGGSGSSRGTWWLTRDLCNGKTLFKVNEGVIQVKDFKDGDKTLVEAGEKVTVGPRR